MGTCDFAKNKVRERKKQRKIQTDRKREKKEELMKKVSDHEAPFAMFSFFFFPFRHDPKRAPGVKGHHH